MTPLILPYNSHYLKRFSFILSLVPSLGKIIIDTTNRYHFTLSALYSNRPNNVRERASSGRRADVELCLKAIVHTLVSSHNLSRSQLREIIHVIDSPSFKKRAKQFKIYTTLLKNVTFHDRELMMLFRHKSTSNITQVLTQFKKYTTSNSVASSSSTLGQ